MPVPEIVKKRFKNIRWAQHGPALKEFFSWVVLGGLYTGAPALTAFLLSQFRQGAPYKNLRLPFLLYLFWAWVLDRNVSNVGGRPWTWFRKLWFFEGYKSYFPSSMQFDFPESEWEKFKIGRDGQQRAFVFGAHPHGIISHTVLSNFFPINEALQKHGIDYRCGTVDINMFFPFLRDLGLWVGAIRASKEALDGCIRRGISVVLVVGGAEEALDARPGRADLKLATRFGFVKLALRHGAGLIPVFGFGENDLYDQLVPNPPGSVVRDIQTRLKDILGFSLPVFKGRWGTFLPNRKPLVAVVGRPIDCPKIEDPSDEQVQYYHKKYVEALMDLHERYKGRYDDVLTIVDAETKDEAAHSWSDDINDFLFSRGKSRL
jgi:hypothetical protein